jgi:hypothetical protein
MPIDARRGRKLMALGRVGSRCASGGAAQQ